MNQEQKEKFDAMTTLIQALKDFGDNWVQGPPSPHSILFMRTIAQLIELYPDRVEALICLCAAMRLQLGLGVQLITEHESLGEALERAKHETDPTVH